VFVKNLPFSVTSEILQAYFSGLGFAIESAHVVVRRFRGVPKSKGFGFVQFANEADQKRAVAEVSGKKLEDRELTVSIALAPSENQEVAV
jgi:RNA recognition motif-containing protein